MTERRTMHRCGRAKKKRARGQNVTLHRRPGSGWRQHSARRGNPRGIGPVVGERVAAARGLTATPPTIVRPPPSSLPCGWLSAPSPLYDRRWGPPALMRCLVCRLWRPFRGRGLVHVAGRPAVAAGVVVGGVSPRGGHNAGRSVVCPPRRSRRRPWRRVWGAVCKECTHAGSAVARGAPLATDGTPRVWTCAAALQCSADAGSSSTPPTRPRCPHRAGWCSGWGEEPCTSRQRLGYLYAPRPAHHHRRLLIKPRPFLHLPQLTPSSLSHSVFVHSPTPTWLLAASAHPPRSAPAAPATPGCPCRRTVRFPRAHLRPVSPWW